MCVTKEEFKKAFTPKKIGNAVTLKNGLRYYDWLGQATELHLFPVDDLPQESDKVIFLGDYHWSIYLNEITCNGVTTTVKGHAKVRLKNNHGEQYRRFWINLFQKNNDWVVARYSWTNDPVNPRNTTYPEATKVLTAGNVLKELGCLISDQLNPSLQALQTI